MGSVLMKKLPLCTELALVGRSIKVFLGDPGLQPCCLYSLGIPFQERESHLLATEEQEEMGKGHVHRDGAGRERQKKMEETGGFGRGWGRKSPPHPGW